MAFVVGINLALAFSLLGLIPSLLNKRFEPFFALHWWAVGLIFVSGVALPIAYPAKALTNPVFYLKFTALSAGLLITRRLQRSVSGRTANHQPPPGDRSPIVYRQRCHAVLLDTDHRSRPIFGIHAFCTAGFRYF